LIKSPFVKKSFVPEIFYKVLFVNRFGRKPMHFLLVAIIAVFGCASAFAPNPYAYAAVRFFAGIGVGGEYQCTIQNSILLMILKMKDILYFIGYYCIYSIYLMEFLTPTYRVVCGSLGLWFLGEMCLALAAYLISSWRILSLVAAAPAAIMLLTYPWVIIIHQYTALAVH
jgi:MFS family permease